MRLDEIRRIIIETRAWTIHGCHVESIDWSDVEAKAIVKNRLIDICEKPEHVQVDSNSIIAKRYCHNTNQYVTTTLQANPTADLPTLHRYSDSPALTALYDLHQRVFVLHEILDECKTNGCDEITSNDIDTTITRAHDIVHRLENGQAELNQALITIRDLLVVRLTNLIQEAKCA